MKQVRLAAAVCLMAAVLSGSRNAPGALLAYEPFDYSPAGADLNGRNGGFGFSGPWTPGGFNASVNDNFDIASGSLSFQQLLTGGNRVTSLPTNAIAGLTRNLATPLGTAGETKYVSVLLRPEGQVGVGAFNGFFGLTLESPTEPEIYIGKPGSGVLDRYVVENRGGEGQVPSNVTPTANQTALLVLKAQFTATNDLFTLYVNPTPGAAEPSSGLLKNDANLGVVNGLTIYSTGAFSIDEIRLGDTFADVTPVPEPGAVTATCVLSCLLLGRRGRARPLSGR
jgi:hypothetical protein